ncbi:MAG: hypothetical protein ABSE79_07300, partial [Terriglobia bacterium]
MPARPRARRPRHNATSSLITSLPRGPHGVVPIPAQSAKPVFSVTLGLQGYDRGVQPSHS